MKVKRIADPVTGNSECYLFVDTDGSDIFLEMKGTDRFGKPTISILQYLAPFGGGYHPRTIRALHALAKAMDEDNKDPGNPARYRQ